MSLDPRKLRAEASKSPAFTEKEIEEFFSKKIKDTFSAAVDAETRTSR